MLSYEVLPKTGSPERQKLIQALVTTLGPLAKINGDRPQGAFSPHEAFALLARFSPTDRLTLTRDTLRVSSGKSGAFLATLDDKYIMLFLCRKLMNTKNGSPQFEWLEHAFRLFGDMPIHSSTTENLAYVIQTIIGECDPDSFIDGDGDTQNRIKRFFSGCGLSKEDADSPYARLRSIGVIPGRRPVMPDKPFIPTATGAAVEPLIHTQELSSILGLARSHSSVP